MSEIMSTASRKETSILNFAMEYARITELRISVDLLSAKSFKILHSHSAIYLQIDSISAIWSISLPFCAELVEIRKKFPAAEPCEIAGNAGITLQFFCFK